MDWRKIMRIDLGMVLAIIFEYIIFIYYADTLFYRKRNIYVLGYMNRHFFTRVL